MSAALEPLSDQPITLIPRLAFVRPEQMAPTSTARTDAPYEIHPVYVMSDVISVTVYVDDLGDGAAEDIQAKAG